MKALLFILLLQCQTVLQWSPDFVPPVQVFQGTLLCTVTNGTSCSVPAQPAGMPAPTYWVVPANSDPTTLTNMVIVYWTNTVERTVTNTLTLTNTVTRLVTVTNYVTVTNVVKPHPNR